MIYFLLSKILKFIILHFVCDLDLNNTLENLDIALTWFETNYMKLNGCESHLLVFGHHYEKMFINIENNRILEKQKCRTP